MLKKIHFPLYKANPERMYKYMEKKNRQLRKAYVKNLTFL